MLRMSPTGHYRSIPTAVMHDQLGNWRRVHQFCQMLSPDGVGTIIGIMKDCQCTAKHLLPFSHHLIDANGLFSLPLLATTKIMLQLLRLPAHNLRNGSHQQICSSSKAVYHPLLCTIIALLLNYRDDFLQDCTALAYCILC